MITRADPAVLVTGTPLSAAQLDATASAPGTCVATPAAGTIPGVGSGPGRDGDVHDRRLDQLHHGDCPRSASM
jgi:hypothetical protein